MNRRSSRGNFATIATRNFILVFVDNLELNVGNKPADCSTNLFWVICEPCMGMEAGFEHSVDLDQMTTHTPAEIADRFDRGRGPSRDGHAQRRFVEAFEIGFV